jgi:hypothetical protein
MSQLSSMSEFENIAGATHICGELIDLIEDRGTNDEMCIDLTL